MSRLLAFAIALALLPALALAGIAGMSTVIDGDTLEIHGERIRLHGVDAAGTRQVCRSPGKFITGGSPIDDGSPAISALPPAPMTAAMDDAAGASPRPATAWLATA